MDEDAILYRDHFDENSPDREEHEGYTGNAGATATYWYRDTVCFLSPFLGIFSSDTIVQVLVIVPSSRKACALYGWDSSVEAVSCLLKRFRDEQHEAPHAHAHLKRICELILMKTPTTYQRSSQVPNINLHLQELYQTVGAIALELGDFDLFNKAAKKTKGSLLPAGYKLLGKILGAKLKSQHVTV